MIRTGSPLLLWFRQDLRLADNAALAAAQASGRPIIPIYIFDDNGKEGWAPGAASRWWLHHSLESLEQSLRTRGSRLILARGDPAETVLSLMRDTGAGAVYWNRRYEPAGAKLDAQIECALRKEGCEVQVFSSALLFEPDVIANKQGRPYQVFTPFWRHCLAQPITREVRTKPGPLAMPRSWPDSVRREELRLLPPIRWDRGFYGAWAPGEAGAMRRLRGFLSRSIADYASARDSPAAETVSKLSPHLHFGEIGPRQVWAAVQRLSRHDGVFPPHRGAAKFLAELGWREFAYHLLHHFPHTPDAPLRSEYVRFPWAEDRGGEKLRAWQRGRTGYPLVDAGMRQLWATGWMHNRVRMVAASFLVKHLRLPWQQGAMWFWDTLVDADLANNTLGWQWSAGCGADAAPYFRIFAPVSQGENCDPQGTYVRTWIPELGQLPKTFIHRPWEAPPHVLVAAGVELGKTYPRPIVDHGVARKEALESFRRFQNSRLHREN